MQVHMLYVVHMYMNINKNILLPHSYRILYYIINFKENIGSFHVAHNMMKKNFHSHFYYGLL